MKRNLILRICELWGVSVETLTFTPIRKGLEMCGASGGWVLYVDIDNSTASFHRSFNPIVGYNSDELIDNLRKALITPPINNNDNNSPHN